MGPVDESSHITLAQCGHHDSFTAIAHFVLRVSCSPEVRTRIAHGSPLKGVKNQKRPVQAATLN
jgi:hypothetical protein